MIFTMISLKFNNYIKLLYTDTDSWIFLYSFYIQPVTEMNFFKGRNTILKRLADAGILDTSNFHPMDPLYSTSNKGALGLVKSEFPNSFIREFVAVSPKVYSLKIEPYHINKISAHMKKYVEEKVYVDSNELEIISYQQMDIESAIFRINGDNTNHIIQIICDIDNILLCNHYKPTFTYVKYLEIEDISPDLIGKTPISKLFYNNDIFNEMKEKYNGMDDNFYYLELDKYFNVSIYKYGMLLDSS